MSRIWKCIEYADTIRVNYISIRDYDANAKTDEFL